MMLGTCLEHGIGDFVFQKLQAEGVKDVPCINKEHYLAANLDAIISKHYFRKWHEEPCVLEIKTGGFKGKSPEHDSWGQGGTCVVPPRVFP
jgi:hypothetical protein